MLSVYVVAADGGPRQLRERSAGRFGAIDSISFEIRRSAGVPGEDYAVRYRVSPQQC